MTYNRGSFSVESSSVEASSKFDDDGRIKRTGTLMTTTAHIITAVIGSGVLSLAWAIAQLGWIAGPSVMLMFSLITWFTSTLLADGYRCLSTGRRNYTYMDAVKANMGGVKVKLCGVAQYVNLIGVCIGYNITASISMAAIYKSNCYHEHGHDPNGCKVVNNPYMIMFGCIQIVLSQIPNFHKLSALSVIAAVMSFAYSGIGLGLSIAKIASGGELRKTGLTGTVVGVDVTSEQKVWKVFQSLGNIAFAYAYSIVLIEIQDTMKSSPPENVVMKKATIWGVSITTTFYMLCGLLGYAAFGNAAPGNFLTGFGFYEPFWLVDIANVAIIVHLVGAWQVFAQPVFGLVERWAARHWPESNFINKNYSIGSYDMNVFRLVWRSAFVIVTSLIAMLFPFFNDFVGLLGALSFWPLTVYFPIEIHKSQAKVRKFSCYWNCLQLMMGICFVVSMLAAVGSIQGLIMSVQSFKPFHSVS